MTATVTPIDKRLTLAAIAVVLLLSALDQTIVATAMPRIIEELAGLPMYAWVTTAYMLTSTVTVPIYGRLSDLYGRKPILIIGVVVFLVGSALCGLAGEFGELPLLGGGMAQLVICRAIQGLGGGALMTVSFAIIADLYPPRERGRLFGVFGSVFGLATLVGPFIGGFFADHGTVTVLSHEIEGWRWVFYVNIPLGMLALFMILYRMPGLHRGGAGRVDYIGAALVVLTAAPLLLALSLGGTSYAWDSPRIVGLFTAAALALVVFLWVELRVTQPMVPLRLFRIRIFRIATLASFVMSMAFLGIVMFMPLYMQVVQGVSATQSGLALLPLMGGLIASSIVSGRLVSRTGRYKPFMVAGGLVLIVGVITLTGIGPDTTARDLAWRLAITGVGLGPAQTLFNLVIQNAVPREQMGAATSMSQFSRQIGATVGVALFGTFLTHNLSDELPKRLPLLPGASVHRIDLAQAQSQAMDAAAIRERVDRALEKRFAVLERAYQEDQDAVREIIGDSRLPEQIKAPLRDGGIRGRIHQQLLERAAAIEAELITGERGRDRLLQDPRLSVSIRKQLADIPGRAFRDPQLMSVVIGLFRDAILAQENAMVAATARQSLQLIEAAMVPYATQLAQRIHRGTKEAFAAAIAQMMEKALWIVLTAVAIILLIPAVRLQGRPHELGDTRHADDEHHGGSEGMTGGVGSSSDRG